MTMAAATPSGAAGEVAGVAPAPGARRRVAARPRAAGWGGAGRGGGGHGGAGLRGPLDRRRQPDEEALADLAAVLGTTRRLVSRGPEAAVCFAEPHGRMSGIATRAFRDAHSTSSRRSSPWLARQSQPAILSLIEMPLARLWTHRTHDVSVVVFAEHHLLECVISDARLGPTEALFEEDQLGAGRAGSAITTRNPM